MTSSPKKRSSSERTARVEGYASHAGDFHLALRGPPPGVAGDALQSQCSQGNCKAASRPTPPACSAALAKACPALGLKYNRCADCVYGAAAWHAIKAAGCLNADAVAYCVGE